MDILEYFKDRRFNIAATCAADFAKLYELEKEVFAMYEENFNAFLEWCASHGVNPDSEATDLWAWDITNESDV